MEKIPATPGGDEEVWNCLLMKSDPSLSRVSFYVGGSISDTVYLLGGTIIADPQVWVEKRDVLKHTVFVG